MEKHLGKFIRTMRLPGELQCEQAQKDPRLFKRSWRNLKYCVKNMIVTATELFRKQVIACKQEQYNKNLELVDKCLTGDYVHSE